MCGVCEALENVNDLQANSGQSVHIKKKEISKPKQECIFNRFQTAVFQNVYNTENLDIDWVIAFKKKA